MELIIAYIVINIVVMLSQITIAWSGYEPYFVSKIRGGTIWNVKYDRLRFFYTVLFLGFSLFCIVLSYETTLDPFFKKIFAGIATVVNIGFLYLFKTKVWTDAIKLDDDSIAADNPKVVYDKISTPIIATSNSSKKRKNKRENLQLNSLTREGKIEKFKGLFNDDLFSSVKNDLIKQEVINQDGEWNEAGLISDKKYLCVLLFKLEKLKIIKMRGTIGNRVELLSAFLLKDDDIDSAEMSRTKKNLEDDYKKLDNNEIPPKNTYQKIYKSLEFLNKHKP